MQGLVRQLHSYCGAQPYEINWHLKNLRTGEMADRNGDLVLPSASTRKTAIMMAALEQVNEGVLSLDQPVTIEAKYQDNNSGTFQHFQPGFSIPLVDVMHMMIIVSDNTCTGIISDMLGLDSVTAYCRRIGMKNTAHRHSQGTPNDLPWDYDVELSNATTPNDLGLLYDLILAGAGDEDAAAVLGCTRELCQLALDILSRQKLRTRLPFRLPRGTRVAHKTGSGKRTINDAGIIYDADDNPLFILAVITDQVSAEDLPDGVPGHAAAQIAVQKLARMCYDHLS